MLLHYMYGINRVNVVRWNDDISVYCVYRLG